MQRVHQLYNSCNRIPTQIFPMEVHTYSIMNFEKGIKKYPIINSKLITGGEKIALEVKYVNIIIFLG